MTTIKLINHIKKNFTNDEILRIFDLANRRVVDNGESLYTVKEQKAFDKIRDTWNVFGKGGMC